MEVLFDRICRENGIEHLLTQPRSPTTTGKVERFHRALRTEFRTDRETVVVKTSVSDAHYDTNTADHHTFVVVYETKYGEDGGDWSTQQDRLSQFMTMVKMDGVWLVDDIRPLDPTGL